MENYSLLMGAAAVMKMAVEMAAVSMEKPSGALPVGMPEQRLLSPHLGFVMAAAPEDCSVAAHVGADDHAGAHAGCVALLDHVAATTMPAAVDKVAQFHYADASMESPLDHLSSLEIATITDFAKLKLVNADLIMFFKELLKNIAAFSPPLSCQPLQTPSYCSTSLSASPAELLAAMANFPVDPTPYIPGQYELIQVANRPQQSRYHVTYGIRAKREDVAIATVTPPPGDAIPFGLVCNMLRNLIDIQFGFNLEMIHRKLLGNLLADEDDPPADGSTPHPMHVQPFQPDFVPGVHDDVHELAPVWPCWEPNHQPFDDVHGENMQHNVNIQQNMEFHFPERALNLNVPPPDNALDLNVLHDDGFIELSDLVNPLIQNEGIPFHDGPHAFGESQQMDIYHVVPGNSSLTLTISIDPSAVEGSGGSMNGALMSEDCTLLGNPKRKREKSSPAGRIRRNSLREGEIDAIVTVIELDIIAITIIIISTIITAVITTGHQMASPINFNQFLEKEKLKSNGSNFTDWFRHVRIFLSGGNLQFVLDAPLGDPPAEDESDEVKAVYATRKTRYSQVQCAILCSLESDLQKRFEHHDPHELMNELKAIFETHAAVECYEASKHFFSCMMEEGSSVSEHMLAMTGHAKKLSDLGIVIPNRLGINRVLQSLPPSYKNFVMNYNMQNMNKELPELFGMLKAAEIEIKKEHQVLMVNKTTSFKKQGKSKGKFKKGGKKAATPPMKPKNGPKPDAECYYCKEKGHWKRNCSKYLADLKSGLVKKKKEGIFDIHVIDVHFTGSRSSTWVFDTGSVAHICNSKQELKNKRQLLKDEVTMRVGNGSKVNVIAVGTLPLHLPSGLVLSLNNCYYVPALSMNIISGSCLMQDGYSFKSENNGCSIFMNNIFYGRAPQKNGLFLLDLDSSDTHIHNIDAKRIKLNDNSTYMWHCRLGHIGVKRMKKLHTDGLLESLDFESLDRCEACLMGKMTKTPFSGMMERATDLLEIIHTDVCGPMSVASRGGYRYVLTFTDDLSRYGYIYFMKHKSETFEKFKEFQSEVENQRNKKIKFLRSDRGGEYLSYEFGMHLKKCGILSQLTPPGTPQRNGVSERRNRTLLDMVRSMMSLTDLPLSFWSYALETAAFTLNRAPSKSVETTPYELWFNKKPKLSFLKVWGCEAYVKKLQPDKLEPKAEKCVFIGYPKETIGYTFYHRSEGKIFVAKNGTFLEKEFLTKEVTGRKVELDEIDESILVDQSSAVPEVVPVPPTPATEEANDNDHETSNEETTEPRRSTRERATPDWYDPCLNVMIVDNNDEDPATYEEAMMSPDSNKWQEAMKSEMGSMYDNKVWTLVDLPDSRKAVENKWIFKRKTDADGMEHWTAVKNILKYLKRTKDMFLCYGGDQELVVTSYTDASWNTDPDDSKSQSGYVFILNGAAVSWASSKQCTVAKSSTESEYIAASEASSEAVWMKRFIVELGVVPSALDPLIIYCDNMGAIANAQEPRSHKRLKHIKLRYHSIREYIEDGEVKICKVHTDLNVADPLTKALPRAKHDQHQNAMGVRYITM
ncbi:hypothetical protein QYE76_023819 [Lolium multiflorum]|uniref:Retrotransposon protein, putative, Ty1-copia subclass n=1 Tax=Lolium multiflorum TaxID=4521 RepID=A0AAD8VSN1_LOLMU|nr:hypothetical protein QYE76_023819 [Lolium multiflorum]